MPVFVQRRRRSGAKGGSIARARRSIEVTLAFEGQGMREVSLLLTDDREIHALNKTFRDVDKPTDVLAFPLEQDDGELGDVIISVERARHQAKSRRTHLDQELELLVVHGTLHLLGYDHGTPSEARKMRAKTRAIRRRLK
jgi:probable rRNA maturation factor